MSVSDDIGMLVLELAENNIRDYKRNDSRWQEITNYFINLDCLLRNRNISEAFEKRLPRFFEHLNESCDAREQHYYQSIRKEVNGVCATGCISIAGIALGALSAFTYGIGSPCPELVLAGIAGACGVAHFFPRGRRQSDFHKHFLKLAGAAEGASPDAWAQAFCKYDKHIREKLAVFNAITDTHEPAYL